MSRISVSTFPKVALNPAHLPSKNFKTSKTLLIANSTHACTGWQLTTTNPSPNSQYESTHVAPAHTRRRAPLRSAVQIHVSSTQTFLASLHHLHNVIHTLQFARHARHKTDYVDKNTRTIILEGNAQPWCRISLSRPVTKCSVADTHGHILTTK